MSFIDEIKYTLKSKDSFKALIYINLIVFVIIMLSNALTFMSGYENFKILSWIAIPANTHTLLYRPWTIITYMFTHVRFLHLLFNLLVLFWFGKLFLQFLSQRQMIGVYILGGISGAIFYVGAFNLIPKFSGLIANSVAIGASASVMAIVISVATLVPNQEVYMMFFGKVKLKYLAIGVIVLDLINIPVDNAGGHIAHLGGALLGFVFIKYYKKGHDITIGVSRTLHFIKELFVPNKEIKVTYRRKKDTKHNRPENDMEFNARKKSEQEEIDKILDKIAKSGYSSLSDKEKEKLFKMSNKK